PSDPTEKINNFLQMLPADLCLPSLNHHHCRVMVCQKSIPPLSHHHSVVMVGQKSINPFPIIIAW
ncbi:MAG: hypothetical protein ABWU13_17400, partial [Limnospira maxima]